MSNFTIHVEPADDTLTFWAGAPGFTSVAEHLAPVVEDVLAYDPDATFVLAEPSIWWRQAGGKWQPVQP